MKLRWALGQAALVILTVQSEVQGSEPDEEIIVTGTREARRDQRDPAAPMDTLKLSEDPRMKDGVGRILDRALGARVQRNGSLGRREVLQLRGAGAHQVAVFLDDIKLTTDRGDAVDLSTLPTGCIDEIQVLRGSAGAAYGSGAQGGVLRLNLARSVPATHVETGVGAFGHFHGVGCTGVGHEDMNLLVSAGFNQGEGDFQYRDLNNRQRVRRNNQHQRVTGLLRGTMKMSGAGRLATYIDVVHDGRGEPGSSEFPSANARSEQFRSTANLTWRNHHLAQGRASTRMTVSSVNRRYRFDDSRPAFGQSAQFFEMQDSSIDARLSGTWEAWPLIRPEVAFEGRAQTAETNAEQARNVRRENRLSGAAFTQINFFPTTTVDINLLGRLDARDGRDPVFIPKIGTRWTPAERLNISLSLGRSFRDPSFDELYFQGAGISGDPNLAPETGWAGDASVSREFRGLGRWRIQLSGYLNRFERLILFVPIDAYRIRASDDFSATIWGVETAVRVRWTGPWLEVNYHFQDPRDDQGRRLPFRPEHRVVSRLGWRWAGVHIHGGATIQSQVNSDRFGHRTLPAYGWAETGVLVDLTHGFELGLEIRNLLDNPRVYDAIHRPQPGRSVYGLIRWTQARSAAPH